MSCFSLPKKLKHLPSSSKKAWTPFTSTLSPKLRRLHNRTRTTATRLLNFRHRRHRSIPTPPPNRRLYYHKQQYQYYQHLQPYSSGPNSPSTVYVDRLFGEASTSKETKGGVAMEASTSGCSSDGGGGGGGGGGDGGGEKKRKKVGNNWKQYVSSMPKIKGVDERAEEFISKFKQQMSLQRQQSIIEFQEMLARSA